MLASDVRFPNLPRFPIDGQCIVFSDRPYRKQTDLLAP